METGIALKPATLEVLLVEQDPGTRGQLVSALARQGYEIEACDTLGEGRAHFRSQPLIVTHANGDTTELQGFVAFVRQHAGSAQPYILAIGEPETATGLMASDLGLDAYVTMPLDEEKLAPHLDAISDWLASRNPALENCFAEPQDSIRREIESFDWSLTTSLGGEPSPEAGPPTTSQPPPVAELAPPVSERSIEDHLPRLLNHVPLALAMFDREMRYMLANERFLQDFGLSVADVIGRCHYEVFPGLHEKWRRLFEDALDGRSGRIDEDVLERSDGSTDIVRWEVRPWLKSGGAVGGVVLSQEIVTEQKRLDRQRIFERNLTQSLFESTATPVLLVRLDGRVARSSPAARALLGLPSPPPCPVNLWELYQADGEEGRERERFEASVRQLRENGEFDFVAGDIGIPGSSPCRMRWSASPHINSSGAVEAVLLLGVLVEEPLPAITPPPAVTAPLQVLDDVPFGLVLLNRNGEILFSNQSLAELLGFGLDTVDTIEAWFSRGSSEPEYREQVLREWRESVWRRQLIKTFSLVTAEGLLKEIEVRPRLLKDGNLLLTLTDVTEARRAEDALRASEAKLRALFQECPTGIALSDRNGAVIDANPALEKMLGASRFELRRANLEAFFDANEVQTHRDTLAAMARGERSPAPIEVRVTSHDNETRLLQLVVGSIRNSAGEPVLTSYFVQSVEKPVAAPGGDIATSSEATESISSWRNLAFEGVRTPVLVTDLRGRIVDANPAAEQFFGWGRDNLIGMGLYRLFMPEDPAGFSRKISDQINLARRWEDETPFLRADGVTGSCRAELFPVQREGISGLLCLVQPLGEPPAGSPHLERSRPLPRTVRHASRNHLQLISSLLHLQQRRMPDSAARAQLQASEQRVRTVGLVEEEILRGADPEALEFRRVLSSLEESLCGGDESPLKIACCDVWLETSIALPLALIASEFLCVALACRKSGNVILTLEVDGRHGRLSVEWDPCAAACDNEENRLEIARLLVEPLGGHLIVSGEPEFRCEADFFLPDVAAAPARP
ncbi:MAG: PAS domain S-box protein [Verrucomicrobiales bacterium]